MADLLDEILSEDDGALLLDDVRSWFADFIRVMNDDDLDLLALWAVHTHAVRDLPSTPRLLIDSPLPGSGKTTCLEHLQHLCFKPVSMSNISSAALLTRILEDEPRTLLLDEVDRTLRRENPITPDLLAIMNSGYKKGSTRPVLTPGGKGGKDWVVKEMPTYAPIAMAGNAPNLPDDTRTRTIRVLLMPDLEGVVSESDWESIENSSRLLQGRIARWAELASPQLSECRPALPPQVRNRFREKWTPLRRVAELAGNDWPKKVDAMAVTDVEQAEQDREDGLMVDKPHIKLMRHLSEEWPPGQKLVSSGELVDLLAMNHPSEWGDDNPFGSAITPQRMGKMLVANYKINTFRESSGERRRGYLLADFLRVWPRVGVQVPRWATDSPSEPDVMDEPSQPDQLPSVTCAGKCRVSRVAYRPMRSASWAASTASGMRRVCLLISSMRLIWVTSRSARRKFPLVARTIAARAAVCARPESSGSGSGRRCATTAVSSSLRSARYS